MTSAPLKYPASSSVPRWGLYLAAAAVAHLVFAMFLFLGLTPNPASTPATTPTIPILTFRLIPPPEGEAPVYMVSANPDSIPPPGNDNIPDPNPDTGHALTLPSDDSTNQVTDAQLETILASEREALRAELNQMTELAMAQTPPKTQLPLPPPQGGDTGQASPGPEGAIRELDLGGFPQPIVDDIMKRYKLKIVTREIKGGRAGDSFLSSASKGSTEQFFGGMEVPAGVYEVFQLSRDSVALMSRLEEQALRDRGMEPLKSRVVKIVFGIVKDNKGEYELGVKSLQAEAVAK